MNRGAPPKGVNEIVVYDKVYHAWCPAERSFYMKPDGTREYETYFLLMPSRAVARFDEWRLLREDETLYDA